MDYGLNPNRTELAEQWLIRPPQRAGTVTFVLNGTSLLADTKNLLRFAFEDLKALDRKNLKVLQTKPLLLYRVKTHSKSLRIGLRFDEGHTLAKISVRPLECTVQQ